MHLERFDSKHIHPSITWRGFVDVGLIDDEEDLSTYGLVDCDSSSNGPTITPGQIGLRLAKLPSKLQLTFFGLLKVTLVIPGTCFRPSLAIDFRAFFSLRECTCTEDPAGIPDSPSPPATSGSSESELLEASSTSAPFFVGGSSGSSSIRGLDIVGGFQRLDQLAGSIWDPGQVAQCIDYWA